MHSRINAPILLFSFFIAIDVHAQSLPDSIVKKIDSLFTTTDNKNTPGYAVGIVRNDSLIYAKGYGMANLEYGVAITPETIFHMASVSKQFTAFSILLLAKQGKLSLDDDIRKYLPWFPDMKEKITVRNLLNHTSGIRDQWQLLAISGTRLDDVITQEHIVKILGKQQALNFKPGERYSYSNSGFTMLAEIVKSVSGQTLRQFSDSAIFKPLGMNSTHFHDDYTEIVKDRSYSYDRVDSAHFANAVLSYSNAGATSLFTNISDMSRWIMNFYNHKVGDQKDIDRLVTKGRLNNGKEIDYALGIGVDTYKGWRQFSHNGGDAGYRTNVTVFPDMKLGIAIFSNLGDANPWDKENAVADLFVSDTAKGKVETEPDKRDSSMAMLKDVVRFRNYAGDYISEDGVQFTYKIENQKMYWKPYGQTYLLVKGARDTFFMVVDTTVKFVFGTANGKTTVTQYWPDNKRVLAKYVNDTTQSGKELQAYAGTYYCPELDCKYGIAVKDHRLVLTNNKYNDAKLTLAGPDQLLCDYWWMNNLMVTRNHKKEVTGFEVNSGRIMHLKFTKIN